jgi:oligogalacturonide transporter
MTVALFAQEMLHPFGTSGISFAIQNISPDVTDVDEMITGRRREGVVATFNNFVKIAAGGLLQFVAGVILEWFGVEVENARGEVNHMFSARARNLLGPKLGGPAAGLRVVHGALPILFTALSLLALRRYTMTRAEHKRIREVVAARHALLSGGGPPEGAEGVTEAEKARLAEIAGQPWEAMWVGRG